MKVWMWVIVGLLFVLVTPTALGSPGAADAAHVTVGVEPSASHYLPKVGDALVYQEYENISSGYGNYSGYTETESVVGYLNVTAVLPNGTDTVHYVDLGEYHNSTGASYPWQARGSFTFSAVTYRYIGGTDDLFGVNHTGVWFYTNSSIASGATFGALNYTMTVGSRDASFGLHPDAGKYVQAIYAYANGTYPDDGFFGNFTAAYTYRAFYDPTTGYIVGYRYDENDFNSQGDGFTLTDDLWLVSSSFTPTTAKAPPGYSVTITVTGLSTGLSWTLIFNGVATLESGTTASLTGVENGTYGYAIRAAGYDPSPAYGWVQVAGAAASKSVAFSPAPTSSGPPEWEILAIVGVVVLVVIVIIVLLVTRRNRRGSAPPRHSAGGQVPYAAPPLGPSPPPISLQPGDQPRIQQVVVREVVKVPCQYCGSLIDSTAPKCPFCGATRT